MSSDQWARWELDYRAQLDVPADPMSDWSALKHTAPNPLAPTPACRSWRGP